MRSLLTLLLLLTATLSYAQTPDTIRIACIGNSITEGFGLQDPETEAYPARLQQLLGTRYQVLNCGISAHTMVRQNDLSYMDETKRHCFRQALDFQPDIVTIMLGTNDSKQWYDSLLHARFMSDMNAMIDSFQTLPSHPRIYLCLPIPASGINYSIRDSVIIGEVIPRIRAVAQERQLPVIDLYHRFLPFLDLLPDMVHPNAAGAMLIAEEIARQIEKDQLRQHPMPFPQPRIEIQPDQRRARHGFHERHHRDQQPPMRMRYGRR